MPGCKLRLCDIFGAQWPVVYRIRRSRRHRPSADRSRYPESPTVLARRPLTVLVAPLLLLGLAGATLPAVHAADGTPAATPAVTPPPQIVSEAAGATKWALSKPVRLKVTGGTLTYATLTAKADGRQVPGEITPTRWSSTGTLVPRSTYILDATAVGPDGQQTVLHETLRTGAPAEGAARHHLPERAHRRRRPAGRRDVQSRRTPEGGRRAGAARHREARHRPGLLVVDLLADRAVPAEAVLGRPHRRDGHRGPAQGPCGAGRVGHARHRGLVPYRARLRDAGVERQAPA